MKKLLRAFVFVCCCFDANAQIGGDMASLAFGGHYNLRRGFSSQPSFMRNDYGMSMQASWMHELSPQFYIGATTIWEYLDLQPTFFGMPDTLVTRERTAGIGLSGLQYLNLSSSDFSMFFQFNLLAEYAWRTENTLLLEGSGARILARTGVSFRLSEQWRLDFFYGRFNVGYRQYFDVTNGGREKVQSQFDFNNSLGLRTIMIGGSFVF